MKISKELFIESINAIQQQRELDSKCMDAFRTILQHDHISGYDNSIVVEQMIKVLEDLTGDEKDSIAGSWIGYFIYELDFGSKYEPGRIKAKDGTEISLATPEDLWNILCEESVDEDIDWGTVFKEGSEQQKIKGKVVHFEYMLHQLLTKCHVQDLTVLTATRYLFFVVAKNPKLQELFDNFVTTPYGISEKDVQDSILNGRLEWYGVNSHVIEHRYNLPLGFPSTYLQPQITDLIDKSLASLLKEQEFFKYDGHDLVQISQYYSSWKESKAGARIPKDVLEREEKHFYLNKLELF